MRQLNIKKIESIRLDKGLTKTQFCQAIGMSIRTYNNLTSGRIHDETILKIAKGLDIHPSQIIMFDNYVVPQER